MLCVLLLPRNNTASELFKPLNHFFEKLNCFFCVGVCMNGTAAMIGHPSGLIVQIKEVAPECKATRCVVHRKMLASQTISPELNSVFK